MVDQRNQTKYQTWNHKEKSIIIEMSYQIYTYSTDEKYWM